MTAEEEAKKLLSVVLSIVLAATSSQLVLGYQGSEPAPATSDSGSPTAPAPMTASELQALVAPIALYPDALVAQILGAATYPDQVAVANYWVGQNKNLTGTALTQAVDKQTWDASVKALTQFPAVLDNLAKNLSWTSSLGQAFHNQQSDVMAAIQTLRAQAKAAGNLKSTPQITVQEPQPQTIVIQPANPQVVYVPQYNPAVIYGTPYVTPGYSTGALVATGLLSFGAGIAIGSMMSGGWGWNSWGCNWHGGVVVYNHNNFYGNSAWHGGYYNGGYHNGYNNYNRNGYNNYNRNGNNNYNRNVNNRNISGNTVNINKGANSFNKQSAQNFSASHPSASNSWAQHNNGGKSDAFSGISGHSGGFGDSGGWSSRADSSRGWGSMHSSGFSGGRFGGGGFGGGGFRGGGFRR
ncbi:MAG: DUF3300 domain-containing protein [Acidobacteriaceae bacterium]|nr:DUF3300 domain-containing protein [Acidobacteriaceae bacterium]